AVGLLFIHPHTSRLPPCGQPVVTTHLTIYRIRRLRLSRVLLVQAARHSSPRIIRTLGDELSSRMPSAPQTDWPFDQPRNCAVLTTSQVVNDGKGITHVYHDIDDHGWQFHFPGNRQTSDAMVVALEEIVKLDRSVLDLADLPPGWMAERADRNSPWSRHGNETPNQLPDPTSPSV